MMSGPATGRRGCVFSLRALLACLMLIAWDGTRARTQTLTSDMLRPVVGGFVSPQDLPLRKLAVDDGTSDSSGDAIVDDLRRSTYAPAASRVGQVPEYGLPPASGAADSGFI